MPATEAKSCGIPVTCTDYSSMYEKNRNGGALPIKVEAMYTEAETMQNRAIFSVNSLVDNINKVLSSDFYASTLSAEGRSLAVDNYSWNLAGKKWEAAIMQAELKDRSAWEIPRLKFVILSNGDAAEDEGTKLNMKNACGLDSIIIEAGDEQLAKVKEASDGGWVFILKSGELAYNIDAQHLLNELYLHGSENSNFSIMKLSVEEGGIDTLKPLFEERLVNPTQGSSPESALMITGGMKEASLFLEHSKRVLSPDYSTPSGCHSLRVAQVDGAEAIRHHVRHGSIYIVDSYKPISFKLDTPPVAKESS
jgi:hypothetical protein